MTITYMYKLTLTTSHLPEHAGIYIDRSLPVLFTY